MNELKPPPSLLTWPVMLPFSVGALGCAALLGLGNGAVFKYQRLRGMRHPPSPRG